MFKESCYIRVCSGAGEKWFDKNISADDLAKSAFRLRDSEHSVYEVFDDIAESRTVAAHLLTKPEAKLTTQFAIRIRAQDLGEATIGVSDTHFGQTGVVSVDFSHRDLIASKEQICKMISIVLERMREGEDRIRKFSQIQLVTQLEIIVRMSSAERPTRTANFGEIILGKRNRHETNNDRDIAMNELNGAMVPEAIVQRLAFRMYENRDPAEGTPETDWIAAQNYLRRAYLNHYLQTQFVD